MECLSHIAAWFPADVKIAGVRLSPPTLGQWRLLEAVGSPFAFGGDATVDDARFALALLSLPWRAGTEILRHPRRLRVRAAWKGMRATAETVRELAEWCDCAWASPERYRRDGEVSGDGFEPCCGISVRYAMRANRLNLTGLFPFRARTVWDLPIPFVLWGCVCASELDGAEFEAEDEPRVRESWNGRPSTPL